MEEIIKPLLKKFAFIAAIGFVVWAVGIVLITKAGRRLPQESREVCTCPDIDAGAQAELDVLEEQLSKIAEWCRSVKRKHSVCEKVKNGF